MRNRPTEGASVRPGSENNLGCYRSARNWRGAKIQLTRTKLELAVVQYGL